MLETWYAHGRARARASTSCSTASTSAPGILAPFVARTDTERRQVLAAIGPYWDGNEVWLLAAGGALFVAFPKALAAGISGFYFAIFLVLWCLIGRGLSIEFRSHVADPLWRSAWDTVFTRRQHAARAVLRRRVRQPAARRAARRGRLVLAPALHDFMPTRAGRDPRLVHGPRRRLRRSSRWPRTAPPSSPGRPTARLRERTRRAHVAARRHGGRALAAGHDRDRGDQRRALPGARATAAGLGPGGAGAGGDIVRLRPAPRGGIRAAFVGSSAFLIGILAATAASLFPVLLRAQGGEALSLTAHTRGEIPQGSPWP